MDLKILTKRAGAMNIEQAILNLKLMRVGLLKHNLKSWWMSCRLTE